MAPTSEPAVETWVSAGLLAVGGDVLASRWTAAYLHGLSNRSPRTVELVVPHGRRTPSVSPAVGPSLTVWRSRTLLRRDLTHPRRLAATAPDRTVCDLAAVTTGRALRALLIDARQRRLLTLEAVLRRGRDMVGTTGLPLLRQVAYELDATRCDSVLAAWARDVLAAAGIPPDAEEHAVRAPNGITVHLDLAYVAYQVAVEPEGMGAHATREQLERDVRRRNTLARLPWHVVGVTWARLESDAAGFVAEVEEALRARGWPGAPRRQPSGA